MLSPQSSAVTFPSLSRNPSLSPNEQLINYLKSGHTISLDGHSRDTTPMLPIRSAKLLNSRGPSYPCLSLDSSIYLAEENSFRRSAHREIMTADPTCFRRKRVDESPSSLALEAQKLKDLIGGLHPTKDVNDINKHRKYTYSIRREKDIEDQKRLDEYHFQTMAMMEDFVRPGDATSKRQTGYEHGHIRSLFKLDTYGPTNSKISQGSRQKQRLPKANVDRYARLSPEHHLNLSPTGSVAGGSISGRNNQNNLGDGIASLDNSSRGSSRESSAGSHRSLSTRRSNPSGGINSSRRFSASHFEDRLDLTIPASLRHVKENLGKTRITYEDRLSFDPLVRRKQYDKTYKSKQKDQKEQRRFAQTIASYQRQQQDIAEVERKRIRKFEKNLTLARFEASQNKGCI